LSDAEGSRITEVNISKAKGDFKGRVTNRVYLFQIHSSIFPKQVVVQGNKLKKYKKAEDFNKSDTGWYFDPEDKKGMVFIKTVKLSTDKDTSVQLKY
jgi:hypothetical protein